MWWLTTLWSEQIYDNQFHFHLTDTNRITFILFFIHLTQSPHSFLDLWYKLNLVIEFNISIGSVSGLQLDDLNQFKLTVNRISFPA